MNAVFTPPGRTLMFACLFFMLSPPGLADDAYRRASHPATSSADLASLVHHGDWQVREAVALNRRTSPAALMALAHDKDQRVRIAVATNISTTPEIFLVLARDKQVAVRSVVARFEYVTAEALAILADDKEANIRMEVARNWNTSEATLKKLLRDEFSEVSNTAEITLAKRRQEKE